MTRSTLKRTVLASGLHWPQKTMSPSLMRKHGDTWAAKLLWRFSYLQQRWGNWNQVWAAKVHAMFNPSNAGRTFQAAIQYAILDQYQHEQELLPSTTEPAGAPREFHSY